MKKIVFINARFLTQSITGVQRYATQLVQALDNLVEQKIIDTKQVEFVLIAPRHIKYELDLKHISLKRVGHLSGHLWEQFELPFYTRGNLLLSLCNTAPLIKRNQLVTICDAVVFGFPQAYSFIFRTWYKILSVSLGIVARKILTISHFSKKELDKYCHIGDQKLQVVYLGSEHILEVKPDYEILEKYRLKNNKFILAVSSINLNKNFRSIILAIQFLGSYDFEIVIAGGLNLDIFISPQGSLNNSIKHLGYVSDHELRALYEHASCFIYPSFYEGFGLPPLEAMACGCPVIVSNTASLPEICGDAALYCNPSSPEDIAKKISLLMHDTALRKEFRQKGLERVKQFSWQKCAFETFAIVEKLLYS